ncbi:MAG TPA: hypothetical protein PKN33_20250 [Phycisphaerae bacterium]|nr:hypothetical protein [Phycisphaerae bacterium]
MKNTHANTKITATENTIVLNRELRRFLKRVQSGQSINAAAWAAQVLRRGRMTEDDLVRCFQLGFEG